MTDLTNKQALEAALRAYRDTPVDIACGDSDENQEICVKAAIRAYLAAMPADGLAARLVEVADFLARAGDSETERLLREAAEHIARTGSRPEVQTS